MAFSNSVTQDPEDIHDYIISMFSKPTAKFVKTPEDLSFSTQGGKTILEIGNKIQFYDNYNYNSKPYNIFNNYYMSNYLMNERMLFGAPVNNQGPASYNQQIKYNYGTTSYLPYNYALQPAPIYEQKTYYNRNNYNYEASSFNHQYNYPGSNFYDCNNTSYSTQNQDYCNTLENTTTNHDFLTDDYNNSATCRFETNSEPSSPNREEQDFEDSGVNEVDNRSNSVCVKSKKKSKSRGNPWRKEEDDDLLKLVREYTISGKTFWEGVISKFPHDRTKYQLYHRYNILVPKVHKKK